MWFRSYCVHKSLPELRKTSVTDQSNQMEGTKPADPGPITEGRRTRWCPKNVKAILERSLVQGFFSL